MKFNLIYSISDPLNSIGGDGEEVVGVFDTIEEAHEALKKAVESYWGSPFDKIQEEADDWYWDNQCHCNSCPCVDNYDHVIIPDLDSIDREWLIEAE